MSLGIQANFLFYYYCFWILSFLKWIQAITPHHSDLQSIQMLICLYTLENQIRRKLVALSMKKILLNIFEYVVKLLLLFVKCCVYPAYKHFNIWSGEVEKRARREGSKAERESWSTLVYSNQGVWMSVILFLSTLHREWCRFRFYLWAFQGLCRWFVIANGNLWFAVQVASDEDLTKQIGKEIYFDLVDHDKVRGFRIQKNVSFKAFKV